MAPQKGARFVEPPPPADRGGLDDDTPRMRESVLVDVGHRKHPPLAEVIPDLNQAQSSFNCLSRTCRKFFLVTLVETIYLLIFQISILLLGEFVDQTSIEDRRVFSIYFGGSAIFCLCLTYHAIVHQSMSEIFGLLYIKLVDVVFAAIQTYQLLAAPNNKTPWHPAFLLSDIQPLVLGAYCAFIYKMIYPLYYEFGQALYIRIGSNKDVNEKVFSYNNLRVGIIVNFVMNTLFHAVHAVLVRQHAPFDFATNVFAVFALLIFSLVTLHCALKEWSVGLHVACLMFFADACYYGFQVYIFDGRHCDYCPKLESSFVFLTLFSIFNIICALTLFALTIKCQRTFGKGLIDFSAMSLDMPGERARRRKIVRSADEPTDMNKRFPFLTPDYKIQTVAGHDHKTTRSSSSLSPQEPWASFRWLLSYPAGVPHDLEV